MYATGGTSREIERNIKAVSRSKMNSINPQDPYESFIVQASAGSGKTYQLSHRFLY